jgi:ketosteroid isomerase-like protein
LLKAPRRFDTARTMSEENVAIVRDWIALSNAGDVPAILNLLAPDIRCFPAEGEPEAEAFRGREAYARRAYEARHAFDRHEIDVSEYIDLGDYVAVVARIHARGRMSQAPVSADEVWLIRFRDGKVVEYRECTTKERALEFAGVAE